MVPPTTPAGMAACVVTPTIRHSCVVGTACLFWAADVFVTMKGAAVPPGVQGNTQQVVCSDSSAVVKQVLAAYRPADGIYGLSVVCGDVASAAQCSASSWIGGYANALLTSDLATATYTGVLINWGTGITSLGLVRNDGNTGNLGAVAAGASATLVECPPGMLVAGFTGALNASLCTSKLWQLGLFCRRGEWRTRQHKGAAPTMLGATHL